MNRVFIGRDPRQPVSATVLAHSLAAHARSPLAITMLDLHHVPITRKGLTTFTFSRYMVPYLCDYEGLALFMDADMLARADVNDLFKLMDRRHEVQVVKSPIRFEWPSLMLFNCEKCTALDAAYVDDPATKPFALDWAFSIGDLPPEWNHCVGYGPRNPGAKVVHFTQGVPVWPQTAGSEFAEEWWASGKEAMGTCKWEELMKDSIHNSAEIAPYKWHDVATGKDLRTEGFAE